MSPTRSSRTSTTNSKAAVQRAAVELMKSVDIVHELQMGPDGSYNPYAPDEGNGEDPNDQDHRGLQSSLSSSGLRAQLVERPDDDLIDNFFSRLSDLSAASGKLLAPSNIESATKYFGREFMSRVADVHTVALALLHSSDASATDSTRWIQLSNAICQVKIAEATL